MRTPRHLARLLAVGLVAGMLTAVPAAAAGPTTVFVNEFHYDNDGTDSGEFIEIAGPAGTDLTDWSLVLYNGSTGAAYRTTPLGGTLADDTGSGHGFVATTYPSNGIQNGSPDGIALVDAAGTVVQFLSYEGTFTAADGPAAGTTSTDIGVAETSSTPVGDSLQLGGSGTTYEDFAWQAAAAATAGAVNAGQTVGSGGGDPGGDPGGGTTPDVFTSELHYDNDGGDLGEAIEITAPDTATDLTGWTIVLYNGNGGGTYGSTVALDGLALVADGDVARGTVDFPTNGIQNGSPDGWALVDDAGTVVEFLSYEGALTATAGPAAGTTSTDIGVSETGSTPAGQSLQRDVATDPWTGPAPETFVGSTYYTDTEPEPTEVRISEVQGAGAATPLEGQDVAVEAIVTALFTAGDALNGFHLQEEDADADGDDATSEALYVFCGSGCPSGLATGDAVEVVGTAGEFFGTTQIAADSVTVLSSGNPLPAPVEVALPAAAGTDEEHTYESTESMVVTFPGTLAVSEYFELARFGSLVLTADSRPYQFTHSHEPSVDGYASFLEDLAARRIILDDDNNDQNDAIFGPAADEAYPYPEGGLSTGNRFRGGDTITGLTGVIDWDFDEWRVRPVWDAYDYSFDPANPAPASPVDVGGDVTVASFNVLNYFTTVDTTSSGSSGDCGPTGTQDCRGADSASELERQRAKIVAALGEIDADVVGLIEIQNDDDVSTWDLVDALNADPAAGTYAAIETGTIGGDAIKVALIYQPDRVTPIGDHAILDGTDDPRFRDDKNRPVLIQTFADADGARFTVAVNHLKSKGSSCAEYEDESIVDGQANCSETRRLAAEALADHLATDPTGSGDADVLLIGDLNAYRMEDAIRSLEDAGYTDLVDRFGGDAAYGYVFDGQLGYLDHALASESLLPQVTGATEWHINADEVPVFDYNDDVRDTGEASFERETSVGDLYEPTPFRSSDHDPVVVGLDLDAPPVADAGGPYEVRRNGRLELDGTGSFDPDGDELIYAWDLDGDGAFDDADGPTAVFDARGDRPGTYEVGLQVTDPAGHTDTDITTVEVARTGRPLDGDRGDRDDGGPRAD